MRQFSNVGSFSFGVSGTYLLLCKKAVMHQKMDWTIETISNVTLTSHHDLIMMTDTVVCHRKNNQWSLQCIWKVHLIYLEYIYVI